MSAGEAHYDWVIVGSGFGGSVSALRLAEKGYKVLVIERGRRWAKEDFPETNWQVKKWLWLPEIGFRGIQKLSFMRHATILSGVGVGGGSLVYANTLPVPKAEFFRIGTWAGLRDWQEELAPHYRTAQRMLGATENVVKGYGDEIMEQVAADMGRSEHFHPTSVAVFFGEPDEVVPDPFFDGEGPERTGCNHCGSCMTGCRYGAKNTLDRNYLYLAEKLDCTVIADTSVRAVRPMDNGGYRVEAETSSGWWRRESRVFTADRVVLSGGVLGTIDLLLEMQTEPDGLPGLSTCAGDFVRTNSESLLYVVSEERDIDHSKGIAIGSILHTDEHSHVEPVRYGEGSSFFRLLMLPHVRGKTLLSRFTALFALFLAAPRRIWQAMMVPDLGRYATVLLYMRTVEGTLRFRRAWSPLQPYRKKLVTSLGEGESPVAYMPEASDIADRFSEKMNGLAMASFAETLFGVPTTAHILGGACIGKDWHHGVIDDHHQVFGYPGLYVVDGSAISANPGVNPSLTITAMAERAMSLVPPKVAGVPVRHIGVEVQAEGS